MASVDPVIHSNKRYRQAQEIGPGNYSASAVAHHPASTLSSQHSGSDQSSPDVRSGSGSDLGAGSMSRSVSVSSLALSAHDSRSSGATMMHMSYTTNFSSDTQSQQILLPANSLSGAPPINGLAQASANVAAFQENPASTNRGPPAHLDSSFFQPSSHVSPMAGTHGCIPAPAVQIHPGTATSGQVANGPIANAPISTNGTVGSVGAAFTSLQVQQSFVAQPNGLLPSNNLVLAPQGYQQNGLAVALTSQSYSSPQEPAAQNPSAAVSKWEPVPATNASSHQTSSTTTGANACANPSPPVVLEPPCAACKSLRRKCTRDCIFLPYFPRDDPDKFARVHKVFGASNVAKMLQDLPVHQREDTVASLEYEAQARVQDPVFGCVGILCLLQKQIAMLQNQVAELQRQQGLSPRNLPGQTLPQDGTMPAATGHQPTISGGSTLPPHS